MTIQEKFIQIIETENQVALISFLKELEKGDKKGFYSKIARAAN